jgi:hypothetical protein
MTWQSPGSGDPAPETKCTAIEEAKVLPAPGNLGDRLMIFGIYAIILVALWFAAPRFMWPDAYIPRPVIPTAQVPNISGVGLAAPPSPQMPNPDFSRRGNPPPGRGSGPAGPSSRPLGDRSATPPTPAPDRTIVIPPSGGRGASQPSPRPAPRPTPRTPDDDRGPSDETIYVPPSNRPKDR